MAFYFSGNVEDQNFVPVVGAQIYVYAGGELATGLETPAGAPLANPIISGANGFYEAVSTQGGDHVLRYYWAGKLRYIREIGNAVIEGPVRAKTITGTSHTVTADDAFKVLRFTANSPITLTLPATGVPENAGIEIQQKGTGQITFVAGVGASIEARAGLNSTAGQFAFAGLRKGAGAAWELAGDLA